MKMEMMYILLVALILYCGVFVDAVGANDGNSSVPAGSSPSVACSSKLAVAANLIPFDTSSLRCSTAWARQDFVLLYKEERAGLWSFVLTAPETNAYIAVGFSPNGGMVGSSAVVGWISSSGNGIAKQYALRGRDSRECPPDQGSLRLVQGSTLILRSSSRLHLAFQLNTTQPQNKLIYSIGPQGNLPDSEFYLPEHDEAATTIIDYATGVTRRGGGTTSRQRTHGLLNLIGWGALMPIGMVVARHCKSWDPAWFYAHISIQGIGFVLGLAGVVTGFRLEDQFGDDVDTHKAIGVFILVAGTLQVMALLVRPGKKAKIRKYWNWYHHNLGRIAVAFAVGNIFYGLSLAGEKNYWTIGYAVFLGIWLILSLVLEVRSCMKKDELSSV